VSLRAGPAAHLRGTGRALWDGDLARTAAKSSLEALNARIGELVAELNDREMRVCRASRRALFERLDRPALRPLPPERFVTFRSPAPDLAYLNTCKSRQP
jgi:hypothetical protein